MKSSFRRFFALLIALCVLACTVTALADDNDGALPDPTEKAEGIEGAEPGEEEPGEVPGEDEEEEDPETPDPADPADPADPDNPDNPADPTAPQNPADPQTPADPAEPQNPETPQNPEDPDDPKDPENPEVPAVTEPDPELPGDETDGAAGDNTGDGTDLTPETPAGDPTDNGTDTLTDAPEAEDPAENDPPEPAAEAAAETAPEEPAEEETPAAEEPAEAEPTEEEEPAGEIPVPEKPEEPALLKGAAAAEPEKDEDDLRGDAYIPASVANENSTRGFVYRMYQVVLGRRPEPAGFYAWVEKLNSGEMTASDLIMAFFGSNEYQSMNKTGGEIVMDCYMTMLNRQPEAAGYVHWRKRLQIGMTYQAVCHGFVESPEFIALAERYGVRPGTIVITNARDMNYERTAFVYRLYNDCLGRRPETYGLESWCRQLENGMAGTEVASGFVFSGEYTSRLPSNGEFVDMLYQTIMGREADDAGRQAWVSQLNYTCTRQHVLNGFMFSSEFAEKCAVAGINVGGKIYEPDNTTEWRNNIQVLALCNEERARYGLPLLITRQDLWEMVGMVRAREVRQYFSHTRPDGSDCFSAYDDIGFDSGSAGENIAYGYGSPRSVVNAWMNSSGHRANILESVFRVLVTGSSGSSWSQNFSYRGK